MKTSTFLFAISFCGLLLGGCVYDDDAGYRSRTVTISREGNNPYGEYDEYAPHYSYSGRRYFRTGGRYVYYSDRRPYYVTTLPTGARYTTPVRQQRGEVRVVNQYDVSRRDSPDWPR